MKLYHHPTPPHPTAPHRTFQSFPLWNEPEVWPELLCHQLQLNHAFIESAVLLVRHVDATVAPGCRREKGKGGKKWSGPNSVIFFYCATQIFRHFSNHSATFWTENCSS